VTDIRKDVAEVLALLSPGAMRLDCSGGGTGARLTGADVAHALGTINDPLGREVLILRGNPDAALHSERQLVDLLYQHVIAEAEARVVDALRARMRGRVEPRQTFPMPRLEGARCPRYHRLVRCCRDELAARERSSGRSLAGKMGIDEKAWRQSWAAPFEWLVQQATEHESEAKRQLAYALSSREVAA
jgi:hypothetical protein